MNAAGRRQLSPRGLLFILTGLNLFNFLDRYVLSAVLPPLQRDLSLSDGQAGRLATVFMLGYFVTSPVFGWMGDRFTRKWLIAVGIFVWSLGTVLTGFATTFAMMVGFRLLVGVGEASYATISPSLISDSYPAEKRNNALTIFYVAIPVGAALGNIIGGYVAAHWGWRHAFIWAGAPGLLLALTMLPFAEVRRGQSDHASAAKPRVRDILKLFLLPDYMLVVLGYTAYTFALGAFGIWGPTFLHRVHGVAVENAGTFFGAVLVVAGLVGTLIGGFAATAWHKRNPAGYAWTLGLSVLVAVPLGFAAFLVHETFWSMTFLAAAMFFLFLSTGPVNTLILESVPANLRASAMAVSIFMIHLFGDMWSPEIVGRIADATGSLRKAVLILPVALLVAAGLWLGLALKTKRAAVQR
ncbi:MAG: MFS transporter [Pedosphaera sp.]|nr:MFS transporter [Pedosphaera sp.]